jgi:predicted DCC family thiol-disulfide oxidoreductase YuxK
MRSGLAMQESFPDIRLAPLERGMLLYDGECGFCSRSVRLLERVARRPFEKRPSSEALAQLPAEVAATAQAQMLWRDADGTLWGGSEALLRALQAAGWPGVAWVLGNPLVRPFTRAGYRLIARIRHRLGAPVCALRPGSS